MELQLIRVANTLDGMFGVFASEWTPFCVSLEKPWRDNAQNISCIPSGLYECTPHYDVEHPEWGMIYALLDVPGRSGIWIHPANLEHDLRGCIAPGNRYDRLSGRDGVLESKAALRELRSLTGDQAFRLRVVDKWV